MATDDRVLAFKWLDFCMSIGLPFRPIRLPVTDAVERAIVRGSKPWSGTVEYLREAREEDFAQTPKATQAPVTWRYRARMKLKKLARPMRSAAFSLLGTMRDSSPYRKLYAGESDALATLLKSIAHERTYLSRDAVRQEKLEMLAETLVKFRRDFAQL